jgi:hypothetical protein
MPHWKKSFPSKYVQAADLDTSMTVTITQVSDENVGTEGAGQVKPVAYFREIRKGVVLNITRGEAIAKIAGSDDTDDWINVRIQLQRGETVYQGKRVPCVEIVPPPLHKGGRKPPTPAATVPTRATVPIPDDATDDDVAF